MDPFLAMMGTPSTEEEQMMMARALRGQSADGARLSTSTIAPVAEQGAQMQQSAMSQARGVGESNYRNRILEDRKTDREATLKLAMEKLGKKKGGFHSLSGSRVEKIYEDAETASMVKDMSSMLPQAGNKSGVWRAGDISNWLATEFPALATEGMEVNADIWRPWNMEYNNILRNGIFGSALTASEQAAWRAASVNPNMTPDQLERNMQSMNDIIRKKAATKVVQLMGEERDEQWLMDTFGNVLPEEFWADPRGYRDQMSERIRQRVDQMDPAELDDELLDQMIREQEG